MPSFSERAVVAAKLATVPDRLVLSGRDSDEGAFRVQRRLDLDEVDKMNLDEVAQVMDAEEECVEEERDPQCPVP